MDPRKVASIMHMLKLTNTTKVLGIVGFYRSLFRDFVTKLALIFKFLKKDEEFNWTKTYSKALKWMKSSMTCLSVLIVSNCTLEFHVHTNTSNLDNTIDCPIYCASELMASAKNNYMTTKKEALAMIT
jgi:hypothetical protein